MKSRGTRPDDAVHHPISGDFGACCKLALAMERPMWRTLPAIREHGCLPCRSSVIGRLDDTSSKAIHGIQCRSAEIRRAGVQPTGSRGRPHLANHRRRRGSYEKNEFVRPLKLGAFIARNEESRANGNGR